MNIWVDNSAEHFGQDTRLGLKLMIDGFLDRFEFTIPIEPNYMGHTQALLSLPDARRLKAHLEKLIEIAEKDEKK